jgi:glyoxylase-like metal-dependent hydrolase (beta-lactamase superfamily II)
MRKFNLILLALVLLIGVPFYWLLLDNRPGDVPAKPITIEQLRTLAEAMPGAKPAAVEVEQVGFSRVPGNLFAAGSGMKRQLISIMAFRLPVTGGKSVLIDTGLPTRAQGEMPLEKFDLKVRARIDTEVRAAGLIVLTHEHVDHLGGVLALNDRALLDKVRFNAWQLPGSRWADMQTWPKGPPPPPPSIQPGAPQAIAPGVVVIPAPSHTLGSQMIFVKLADGREFLFTGDIATMAASWQELRARSRLIGDWFAGENRREVYAWLKTIRALHAAAPKMQIIAGHDYEWIVHDPAKRGVREHFSG